MQSPVRVVVRLGAAVPGAIRVNKVNFLDLLPLHCACFTVPGGSLGRVLPLLGAMAVMNHLDGFPIQVKDCLWSHVLVSILCRLV